MVHQLTGLEKASVLIMSLGATASAKVFEQLTPEERALLGAQIIRLDHIDDATRHAVIDEVNSRVSQPPFKWLEDLDMAEVTLLLDGERPQSVALVVAHLCPEAAAGVLARLDEPTRLRVTQSLGSMSAAPESTIEAVDAALRRRYAGEASARQGSDTLLAILGHATGKVRNSVMNALSRAHPLAADEPFSSPEDLARLSDSDIQAVLCGIGIDDLSVALTVAGDDLKSAVLRNVSIEERVVLENRLAASTRVKVSDVDAAQQTIVHEMERLTNGAFPRREVNL